MCEELCQIIQSRNDDDIRLALGIIQGLVDNPSPENIETLGCIQKYLVGIYVLRNNNSGLIDEIENRIFEAFGVI